MSIEDFNADKSGTTWYWVACEYAVDSRRFDILDRTIDPMPRVLATQEMHGPTSGSVVPSTSDSQIRVTDMKRRTRFNL